MTSTLSHHPDHRQHIVANIQGRSHQTSNITHQRRSVKVPEPGVWLIKVRANVAMRAEGVEDDNEAAEDDKPSLE